MNSIVLIYIYVTVVNVMDYHSFLVLVLVTSVFLSDINGEILKIVVIFMVLDVMNHYN